MKPADCAASTVCTSSPIVADIHEKDKQVIAELLTIYAYELRNADQHAAADKIDRLTAKMLADEAPFVKVQPVNQQVEQSVSTE